MAEEKQVPCRGENWNICPEETQWELAALAQTVPLAGEHRRWDKMAVPGGGFQLRIKGITEGSEEFDMTPSIQMPVWPLSHWRIQDRLPSALCWLSAPAGLVCV